MPPGFSSHSTIRNRQSTISLPPPGLHLLPRSFFLRPTLTVAQDLLGKYLVRRIGKEYLVGRIVEVEAYLGKRDPASHAYRGKTKRNEVMFREGGHLYVYFTYGMHFCANVVTRSEGVGEAVLLRAVEPVQGIGIMKRLRDGKAGRNERELTNGPAKLCEAFGIGRKENGTDLAGPGIMVCRRRGERRPPVARSTRIGISVGTRHRWRYFVRDNAWVSRKGALPRPGVTN